MGASIWDDDPKLGWFIIGLTTGFTTLLMVDLIDLCDVHFLSKLVIEKKPGNHGGLPNPKNAPSPFWATFWPEIWDVNSLEYETKHTKTPIANSSIVIAHETQLEAWDIGVIENWVPRCIRFLQTSFSLSELPFEVLVVASPYLKSLLLLAEVPICNWKTTLMFVNNIHHSLLNKCVC